MNDVYCRADTLSGEIFTWIKIGARGVFRPFDLFGTHFSYFAVKIFHFVPIAQNFLCAKISPIKMLVFKNFSLLGIVK